MSRLRWLIPTLYIVFLLLPIYWLVSMSFKTTNEILGAFTLWPNRFTLENYAKIFSDPTWYNGDINSLIYVGSEKIFAYFSSVNLFGQSVNAPRISLVVLKDMLTSQ